MYSNARNFVRIVLPPKRELNFQGSGPPRERPERCPKSARSWGELPNPTLIDFCSILASLGDPTGDHFRHFGRHFGGPKKEPKKNCEKKRSGAVPGGGFAECAGLLGRIMEGSKLSRKVQSRKCRANRRGDQRIKLVVWHAPATLRLGEPPGAGGLTTPKGGAPPAPHLVQGPSELWTSSGVALCWVCCAVSAAPCLPVQCPREL